MRRACRRIALCVAWFTALAAPSRVSSAEANNDRAGLEFFEQKIRPALLQHCYEWRSATSDDLKGGLRLDTRDAIRKGGDSGHAVVPGDVESSVLIGAIRYDGLEMPPERKLPDAVIVDFETWIRMGAPD